MQFESGFKSGMRSSYVGFHSFPVKNKSSQDQQPSTVGSVVRRETFKTTNFYYLWNVDVKDYIKSNPASMLGVDILKVDLFVYEYLWQKNLFGSTDKQIVLLLLKCLYAKSQYSP